MFQIYYTSGMTITCDRQAKCFGALRLSVNEILGCQRTQRFHCM